jgi:hypothetical protein
MNGKNMNHQAERGVQMQIIQDADLQNDQLKVEVENKSTIYSILKDINYSIHEV